MRSAVVAAAFVAGAIAVPFQKRDVVTDIDMSYITSVVYVTATEDAPAAATSSSVVEKPVVQAAHFGHHPWHAESSSTSEAAPVETSVFTTVVVPTPSTTSTPIYVAPTTTSTPIYVAPTTSSVIEKVMPTIAPAAVIPTIASIISSVADSSSESAASPTSYQEIAVFHHNIHRANHSAPDLAWDDDLASTAAKIASSCVYAHDTTTNGGGYGQNIAAGVEPANISAVITDLFYNGEVNFFDGLYGQENPSMDQFERWGHFSQIVWKASTHVGCATQHCPGGLGNVGSGISPYFTVCNYKEVGNMGGEYGSNIGESLNKPTADWNAGGIA